MEKRLTLAPSGIGISQAVDCAAEVWTIQHVARYLHLDEKSTYPIVSNPDFPNPVANRKRNRRWLAIDVREYFANQSKAQKPIKKIINPQIEIESFEPTSYIVRKKRNVA
jgi:predicted DNA-binding transcriptional regulator AlpA